MRSHFGDVVMSLIWSSLGDKVNLGDKFTSSGQGHVFGTRLCLQDKVIHLQDKVTS